MNSEVAPKPSQHSSRWLVVALCCVGTFMSTLDVSILNVALPTLTKAFHTHTSISQWFVLSYNFVITALLLTFGKLADLLGRKRLYVWGILVFVVGSLMCGLSGSSLMMILARALQGVGSAIMMSTGNALVTQASPSEERGRSLGFVGMTVALGFLAGPLLGGSIIQHATWRWLFFINIPIGLVLATLLTTRVHGLDTKGEGRLDILGNAVMVLALIALLSGLTFGERLGWTSVSTIGIFAAAAALTCAFIGIERRIAHPLLDLDLFKNREFSIGAIAGWTNYASTVSIAVFFPFYLQNILNYPPQKMGIVLACGFVTLAFVAPIVGSLSDRIGSRVLTTIGLFVAGIGLCMMRTLTPASTCFDVISRLVVVYLGSAIFVSPNSSSIMGSVKRDHLGVAAGAVALVRNLGLVCGIALAGAIIATVKHGVHVDSVFTENLAFLTGLRAAFLASAVITFFGSFMSSFK